MQTSHICDVIKIYKFWQVTIFDDVFGANVLMLMVVIFTIFGEADCGKALRIEGAVVAVTQIAVGTEDELGSKLPEIISFTHRVDVARKFARSRIIFTAGVLDAAHIGLSGRRG